jgi:dihydrodipicolinate synthase/N-acetylneuraminate lyase
MGARRNRPLSQSEQAASLRREIEPTPWMSSRLPANRTDASLGSFAVVIAVALWHFRSRTGAGCADPSDPRPQTPIMTNKFRGVMQSPVTPLRDDFSLDLPTFEKVLDFHVRTGATAISWPHHKGESLNLTIAERKRFAEAAVKTVAGRIPVTIHVSALAVEDTFALARHAQDIGADGILAITPYFWTPTREAIHDYFVRLCTSIELPVLSYNSPSYLAGVEITGELMARLIERLPNFVGVKEASFNSEKFLEISRAALKLRPDFALVTGVEFLLPSVPLGGVGSYSAAGSICPNLCRDLFEACVAGDWPRARELQYKVSRLWALFRNQYPSSLKGGMVIMGRPVGPTRPPLPTASAERQAHIRRELEALGILDTEPHGW